MTSKERFLKYITYHTTSSEESEESPSTQCQLTLARALAAEMTDLGLRDVSIDSCGNVTGTLPATEGVKAPAVAFMAHMDTSCSASGENVKAREVLFDGADIPLGHGAVLGESMFPFMSALRGKTLIVTDGSTLLGADDKSGIAEIMTMAEDFIRSGDPHGELRLVFTTDEEVGRGIEGLDVGKLACRWGYTVDGGELGSYEYDNFNAASAKVTVHGVGIHPGAAKDVMKNAITIAMELHEYFPADQVPEKTEGRQGYIHLMGIRGDVVTTVMHYLIRDHDMALFEEKKQRFQGAVNMINLLYGPGTAEVQIADTYYNMREKIQPYPHLLERVERAYAACGVTPHTAPIRGGTDGAMLTWKGLPCPNLSTGAFNCHGIYEFIPTDALETMPKVLKHLAASFIES